MGLRGRLCAGTKCQILTTSSCGMLSAKQEAKMNWVKCTDMRKQPIFVNIENATTILWNEVEKASIVAFASSGGDSIKVLEKPEAVIRGQ
jgi:hypothetical protein